jgi:hypothetical protein
MTASPYRDQRRTRMAGAIWDAPFPFISVFQNGPRRQVACNLCDDGDGFLTGDRCLIHDRDPLFTTELLGTLAASGVKSVKLPPRSPNWNPHAERFVRTIKESCLDRMILFGEGSLRKTIREFVAHYHRERNLRGLGNRLIIPDESMLVMVERSGAASGWAGCLTTIIGRPPEGEGVRR